MNLNSRTHEQINQPDSRQAIVSFCKLRLFRLPRLSSPPFVILANFVVRLFRLIALPFIRIIRVIRSGTAFPLRVSVSL